MQDRIDSFLVSLCWSIPLIKLLLPLFWWSRLSFFLDASSASLACKARTAWVWLPWTVLVSPSSGKSSLAGCGTLGWQFSLSGLDSIFPCGTLAGIYHHSDGSAFVSELAFFSSQLLGFFALCFGILTIPWKGSSVVLPMWDSKCPFYGTSISFLDLGNALL